MEDYFCLKWNNHSVTFLQNLRIFHDKELYCDATLTCQGNYYPVHKLVLASCSDYFKDIFEKAECKHPFVILKDMEPKALEALLDFMYKGEVNVLHDTIAELFKLAETLKIKGLAIPDEVNSEEVSPNQRKRSLSPVERRNDLTPDEEEKANKKVRMSDDEPDETKDNLAATEQSTIEDEKHADDDDFTKYSSLSQVDVKVESTENNDEDSFDDNSINFFNKNTCEPEIDVHSLFESLQHSLFRTDTDSNHFWNEEAGVEYDKELNDHDFESLDLQCETGKKKRLKGWSRALQSTRKLLSRNSLMNKCSLNQQLPFQCTLCPYKCKKDASLQKHIMGKHLNNATLGLPKEEDPEKLKNYLNCCFCTYTTIQPSRLKSHMSIHTGYRPFSCTYCTYRSSQSGTMKRHIQKVHKDKFQN